MKGNSKVLGLLNERLTDELTAVHQHISHAGLLEVQGHRGLAEKFWCDSRGDLSSAEQLIARITFLEGKLTRTANEIASATTVEDMLKADLKLALASVDGYNETIGVCLEVGDHGTRRLVEGLLGDAERRVQFLESQVQQIKQIGVDAYMASTGAPPCPATSTPSTF